jgi:hypothetical protein
MGGALDEPDPDDEGLLLHAEAVSTAAAPTAAAIASRCLRCFGRTMFIAFSPFVFTVTIGILATASPLPDFAVMEPVPEGTGLSLITPYSPGQSLVT